MTSSLTKTPSVADLLDMLDKHPIEEIDERILRAVCLDAKQKTHDTRYKKDWQPYAVVALCELTKWQHTRGPGHMLAYGLSYWDDAVRLGAVPNAQHSPQDTRLLKACRPLREINRMASN